jgi:DNA polymerase
MSSKLYHEYHEIISQSRALLQELQRWGFATVPVPALPDPPEGQAQADGKSEPLELTRLQEQLQGCTRCPLSRQRSQVVFGVGNPDAALVLVGEAPGREEDRQGIPFVGEAGRLLDRILAAMNLSREQVYICNLIKCRPPGNRDPQPEEIACCEPFLKQQLALIRPQLIVALGRFATQALLRTTAPIGTLRGNWHEYEGIPLMPTFHPAYLLRNPAGKREVWEDMKQVMARLQV